MVGSDQIQDELVAVGVDAPKLYLIGIYAAVVLVAFKHVLTGRALCSTSNFARSRRKTCTIVELQGRAARIRGLVAQVPRIIGTAAFVVASIGFLAAGLRGNAGRRVGHRRRLQLFPDVAAAPAAQPVATRARPAQAALGGIPHDPRHSRAALSLLARHPGETPGSFWRLTPRSSIGLLPRHDLLPGDSPRASFGTINVMLLGTTSWVVAGSVPRPLRRMVTGAGTGADRGLSAADQPA